MAPVDWAIFGNATDDAVLHIIVDRATEVAPEDSVAKCDSHVMTECYWGVDMTAMLNMLMTLSV